MENKFTVNTDTALLEFLFGAMPSKSRTTVKSFLTHRQVSVNDIITTKFDARLRVGDKVTVNGRGVEKLDCNNALKIVYEDDSIIVINKRSGLLSMATDKEQQRTAYHILSEYLKRQNPDNRIFIIHRLDRETSGLMMFAKSQQVQETMQRGWRRLVRDRRYVAVIEGELLPAQGMISANLTEDKNHKVWVCTPDKGEEAVTHYSVIRRGGEFSLVDLKLETGKKNQIRAHLEWKGCPIAGDKKYNAKTNPVHRVCLHAYKLFVTHPVTGEELDFQTTIPAEFEKVI